MDRIIKTYRKIAQLRPSEFWPGFLVGIVYFSYIFRWLWSLYPLDAFGVTNEFYSFLAILFVFLVSVAGMATFWGGFYFLIFKLSRTSKPIFIPLVAGGVFVLSEYIRAWGFGFLWLGSGSLLGPHWTLGNPAYLLVSWPFVLKISSVWGIYGIDFLLVWIASIIFLLTTGRYAINSKTLFFNLGLIVFIFFVTTGLFTKNNKAPISDTVKVSVVQAKEDSRFKSSADGVLDDYSKKLELLKEAADVVGGGLVIFPESSNFSKTLLNFLDNNSAKNYFNKLSDKELTIIDNNILQDQEGFKSRTLFINSQTGVSGFYDKQLLTPGGEYLPYVLKFILSIFQKNVSTFEDSGLKAGTHSELLNHKNIQAKILVCSDVISPSISSQDQYGLLVSLQNLGVFKGSNAIGSQFLTMLQFRAAENGKYAVLASNFGRSYVIDDNGNIIKSTDSSGYQLLTADIVPNKERTWYNKLGDLPILLLSLAIFSYGFKKLRDAKQD